MAQLSTLIDSHAHLSCKEMQEGLSLALERATFSKIEAIINITTNPDELQKGSELCHAEASPKIFLAGSTTPHDAEKEGELHFESFAQAAKEGKLIAVGETGLDYHYYKETAPTQKKVFRKYLELAREIGLPVIVHCREAFDDFFEIIDEEKASRGVLHCFTGTKEDARKLIERGWFVSFSGIVTYKKSQELQEIAKWLPIEKLLIETDSPYLAPQAFRGRQNEPSYLVETAKFLAELKNIPFENFARVTVQNTKNLFGI